MIKAEAHRKGALVLAVTIQGIWTTGKAGQNILKLCLLPEEQGSRKLPGQKRNPKR